MRRASGSRVGSREQGRDCQSRVYSHQWAPGLPTALVAPSAQLHLRPFSPLVEDRVGFPSPAPLLPFLMRCWPGPHHPHDEPLNIPTWAPGLQMSCLLLVWRQHGLPWFTCVVPARLRRRERGVSCQMWLARDEDSMTTGPHAQGAHRSAGEDRSAAAVMWP